MQYHLSWQIVIGPRLVLEPDLSRFISILGQVEQIILAHDSNVSELSTQGWDVADIINTDGHSHGILRYI